MARWVVADDADHQSDPDSDIEELDVGEAEQQLNADQFVPEAPSDAPTRKKISIKIGGSSAQGNDVCHVCGQRGHFAGFIGARYIDCINKPCYLCNGTGHSTSTCPYRVKPGHNCKQDKSISTTNNIATLIHQRELSNNVQCHPAPKIGDWCIDAAVLKLHARRTTCLEFHPRHPALVISGDKKGQIAVWDLDKVFERTVYTSINRWLTNGLRVMPSSDAACATASYDGTVKIFDIEVGTVTSTLYNANPNTTWDSVEAEDAAGRWTTMMCCDVIPQGPGIVIAGDSKGKVVLIDPRSSTDTAVGEMTPHKKNTKVQCINVHPVDSNLVLTAGNDYHARILDLRCMGEYASGMDYVATSDRAQVLALVHSKVINAAYFSPVTGRKIMTTAQDNRIRIWDNWTVQCDNPTREIVHSNNFNRYLTPFKCEWDSKDPSERIAVIGRYISEDFGGVALHPIDIIDVATGALLSELVDPNLETIGPVNKPHPTMDIIVSGSSRSLYAWRPRADGEDEDVVHEELAGGGVDLCSFRFGSNINNNDNGAGPSTSNAARRPRGSSHYVFFDADDDEKKKRAGGKRKSGGGTQVEEHDGKTTDKGKKKKREDDDDSDAD